MILSGLGFIKWKDDFFPKGETAGQGTGWGGWMCVVVTELVRHASVRCRQ
jgi:hypothetical protein